MYIDMDGVLCDWDTAAIDIIGKLLFFTPHSIDIDERTEWLIESARDEVGSIENLQYMLKTKRIEPSSPLRRLTKALLSDPKMEDWWANLNPTKFFGEIIEWCSNRKDIAILTTPIDRLSLRNYGCMRGKIRWAKQYVPDAPVIFANDKSVYAFNKDDVLIDDSQENITAWEKNGGTGILIDHPTIPVTTEWLSDMVKRRQ